jgi:hypothetical protein
VKGPVFAKSGSKKAENLYQYLLLMMPLWWIAIIQFLF